MTRTKPRRDIAEPRRAIRPRRPSTGLLASLLLALVMSAGMVTYALWNSGTTMGAVITSGNLGISLGDFSWECGDDCGSGTGPVPDVVLTKHQRLVLRQEITTDFVGDNLNVAISAYFCPSDGEDCSLPDGVSATWHLEIGGTPTSDSDVPMTESIMVPSPTNVGTLVVVVTLQTQLEPSWVDPTTTAAPAADTLELGVMTITANQVRCGMGFSVSCLAGSVGGG